MHYLRLLLMACGLFACVDSPTAPAPTLAVVAKSNRYVVQLQPGAPPGFARKIAKERGVVPEHVFERAIQGFAARMTEAQARALAKHPRVLRVEIDGRARMTDTVAQALDPARNLWGLDRVDDRTRLWNNVYRYDATGTGVHVYVLDTGIDDTHPEFGGRVSGGVTFVFDGFGTMDCQGHGTHVAGTVGGTTVGVAKRVSLHPIRVLDCGGSGYWSDIIAGAEWVITNGERPAILTASLGGGYVQSVNDAFDAAVKAGVAVSVAAGNNYQYDACTRSPAATPSVLTVGASNGLDLVAQFSNIGTCVDVFAPGEQVESSIPGGGYATYNGTSMATPHVAGAMALAYEMHPEETGTQIQERIRAAATPNALKGYDGGAFPAKTANLLLYTLGLASVTPGEPPPPPTSTLTVTPTSVYLTTQAGGDTAYTSVSVTNPAGLGGLAATVDRPWLMIGFISGGYVAIWAVPDGLAAGTYTGNVAISQPGATNTPINVPVTFVVQGPQPATAYFTIACKGNRSTCVFNGSSSTSAYPITSYAWEFGDGTTASGVQVTHKYARTGTFTAKLTITDSQGRTSSMTRTVKIRRL